MSVVHDSPQGDQPDMERMSEKELLRGLEGMPPAKPRQPARRVLIFTKCLNVS